MLIIAVFAAMLFLNLFFRVKVMKLYRYLVQNRVDLSTKHFFDDEKLQQEIVEKYPQHEQQIKQFVGLIRRSITMASILIVIIFLLGYTLMKFR
jgi:hypothetical protein